MLQRLMIASFLLFSSSVTAFRPASTHSRLTGIVARRLTAMSSSSLDGKVLVSVQEALTAHRSKKARFFDGSWFLQGRNGRQEYEKGPRIEGASFFDIDDIAAPSELNPKKLPHMMPTNKLFNAFMDAMGISNDDDIIVYGTEGCVAKHRAWFQIRAMGHEKLHLMQGNLANWIERGGPTEEGEKKVIQAKDLDLTKETSYQSSGPNNVVDINEVLKIIGDADTSASIMVDVRSRERFLGIVEEPRPNMRLGHMPLAINLPFTDLLDPNDMTRFKSVEEMRKIIAEAGIDLYTDKEIVASCGSGATACCLVAALDICGRNPTKTAIYDGSWAEWGGEADTPIVKD